ncbi:hypothetical protein N0V86_007195 [Didymella sp. IMI 355093]|nr:hypothetical protein N0V86_007195 [Didymella sp. IMI 355093]
MANTLRERYHCYQISSKHDSNDTIKSSTYSSCAPSRLALDFGDDLLGFSLVEFFQNYKVADAAPVSSTNSLSHGSSPTFSAAGSNTSHRSATTSVSSLRSFKLGLIAAGLLLFPGASVCDGNTITSDHGGAIATQNCPACDADTSKLLTTTTPDSSGTVKHSAHAEIPEDKKDLVQFHGKQHSEHCAPYPELQKDAFTTHTLCTNDNTSIPRTAVSGLSEEETALERHQWEVIEEITDESLKQLLRDAINQKPTHNIGLNDCSIESRFHGGYNHVVMMSAVINKRVKQYVVRIPAVETKSRWREGDAHNMRCEISLTKYLQIERLVPVPKIFAFNTTLDTVIGAPFILMKLMRGRPAQMIWYDEPGNRTYETTSKVTPETEFRRCNFLHSLAFQMSKLEHLRFDKIGMPDFTDTLTTDAKPKVTCSYHWKSPYEMKPEDLESDDQIYKYGPFDSSQDYMTAGIDTKWPNKHTPDFDEYPDTENMFFNIRKVLDILYSYPLITTSTISPLSTEEPESFVLSHPNLDFQNILTDEEGNVTGIIDWKGCTTMPRCAGYSAVPDFLRRYWVPEHVASDMPHMDWQVDRYVQIYTDAMREFSPKGAVYTRKSAMYEAIVRAVTEGNAMDLCQKLFRKVPAMCGTDADTFEQLIGKGCSEAEAFVRDELEKLLAPDDVSGD